MQDRWIDRRWIDGAYKQRERWLDNRWIDERSKQTEGWIDRYPADMFQ